MKCIYCSKEFTPTHHSQQICSDECRYQRKLVCNVKSRQKKMKVSARPFEHPSRDCKHCKKSFVPRVKNQLYCRPECREIRAEAAKLRFRNYLDLTFS